MKMTTSSKHSRRIEAMTRSTYAFCHAEKERQRKLGTTRGRPRPARAGTARASHITRRTGKLGRVCEWDGWGRLSVDGPGHYNPDRSEGPWGRAVKPLARRCHSCAMNLDTERGLFRRQGGTKDGCKPSDAMIRRHKGRPRPISRPWSRTRAVCIHPRNHPDRSA